MKFKQLMRGVALTAALAWAGVAGASQYEFTLTGDYAAHWTADTNFSGGLTWIVVAFYGVQGTFPDTTMPTIYFWSDEVSGGVEIIKDFDSLVRADGPQLYIGSELDPTFKTGTFALTQHEGSGSYALTIKDITPVPEPETYAMLLAGLGMIGYAARRRKSA